LTTKKQAAAAPRAKRNPTRRTNRRQQVENVKRLLHQPNPLPSVHEEQRLPQKERAAKAAFAAANRAMLKYSVRSGCDDEKELANDPDYCKLRDARRQAEARLQDVQDRIRELDVWKILESLKSKAGTK
jgi:hypothetical protein